MRIYVHVYSKKQQDQAETCDEWVLKFVTQNHRKCSYYKTKPPTNVFHKLDMDVRSRINENRPRKLS